MENYPHLKPSVVHGAFYYNNLLGEQGPLIKDSAQSYYLSSKQKLEPNKFTPTSPLMPVFQSPPRTA